MEIKRYVSGIDVSNIDLNALLLKFNPDFKFDEVFDEIMFDDFNIYVYSRGKFVAHYTNNCEYEYSADIKNITLFSEIVMLITHYFKLYARTTLSSSDTQMDEDN